ncbi:hypothetical protein ACFFX0_04770 [Citricoccus parietis]|uniref:Uncharacterized protein n=1 Tax=Citricoccus parietis TaxID=592307 RepID=A0ABV5FV22_9MICC
MPVTVRTGSSSPTWHSGGRYSLARPPLRIASNLGHHRASHGSSLGVGSVTHHRIYTTHHRINTEGKRFSWVDRTR